MSKENKDWMNKEKYVNEQRKVKIELKKKSKNEWMNKESGRMNELKLNVERMNEWKKVRINVRINK